MKHATEDTLRSISSLLEEMDRLPDLKKKKPGVYYRKSRAFLHFHEDPTGIYADVRLGGRDFERHPVNTRAEQSELVRAAKNFADIDSVYHARD